VIGVVLLAVLALSGSEADAAPLTVRLAYTAGPRCPDAAAFKAVVIARLGYDPFDESAPDQVLVRLEPRRGTIDGRIEWRRSTGAWAGEQTFPSVDTDCPRLVRAIGFALAVHIQFLARMTAASRGSARAPAETGSAAEAPSADTAKPPVAPPPPSRGSTVESSPAVESSPTVESSPAVERAPARGPGLAVGTGPAVGFGMSSEPVLLARVFGVVGWQRVSIELAAVAGLPTMTRRADGAGVSQQHLLGSAAACATAAPAAAGEWSGCVVAMAGTVRMAGDRIDRPTSASLPIVEAGLRAGVRQGLGRRAFVSAHVDGLMNVTRWTATLDQVPVWTSSRFAATLGVEAGLLFP
jgi:hypothetical protein